jgi:hypothetical protein
MAQDLDLKTLDRRVIDRLLKRGELHDKDVEKFLKQQPDLTEEALSVESKFERSPGINGEP